jgi:threonine dehydrogenase-like Zn-dependent dehydrogenase
MRAAIIEALGAITVGDRPYPVVSDPTDAVVRVVLTCVCGGDLWQYRGESPFELGPSRLRSGHLCQLLDPPAERIDPYGPELRFERPQVENP